MNEEAVKWLESQSICIYERSELRNPLPSDCADGAVIPGYGMPQLSLYTLKRDHESASRSTGRCSLCGPEDRLIVIEEEAVPLPKVEKPQALVGTDLAAEFLRKPGEDKRKVARRIYYLAREGRITRHGGPRRGQALWDLYELEAFTSTP